MRQDDRVLELLPRNESARFPRISDDDCVAVIKSGDLLEDYALAVMAEAIAKQPHLILAYSDEDSITETTIHHSPLLKPNWGPIFHASARYLGRLTCIKYSALLSSGALPNDLLLDESGTLEKILAEAGGENVGHVRRILYHVRKAMSDVAPILRADIRTKTADVTKWPEVSIIIPTRDHAHLLSACTHGLKETTDYPFFNVIVVDNGSVEPAACALLAKLRTEPQFKILERPYPFNYSQLCNDGVCETAAPIVVFLNNDIQFIEAGWLKAMVHLAMRPEIGVVGAKLLFPNGKIQHAGVVLGMGGIAGHVYRQRPPQEAGYFGQLVNVRETSAVTAACIAVERAKFESVGRFDADNLPIDLNDIDLCLRMMEKGWTNLWTPHAVMTHAQSASRGIERDPFHVYRRERAYFVRRWAEAIRDDPYFHPALSLFSQRPALG